MTGSQGTTNTCFLPDDGDSIPEIDRHFYEPPAHEDCDEVIGAIIVLAVVQHETVLSGRLENQFDLRPERHSGTEGGQRQVRRGVERRNLK